MQGQVVRIPPVDFQSRHIQVIAIGAAAAAGFWAGVLYGRSSRGVSTRDAAVNTGAEQPVATLMNGHISEADTASQASTPRSVVNADGDHATAHPGSCKMLIIVRTDLLMGISKLTVQCSQAAIGWYKRLYVKSYAKMVEWEKEGSQRVCYAAADPQQFALIRKLAKDAKLATYAVLDKASGDAQTIMAVGPVPADLLGQMTKSLSPPIQAHPLS